jgi:uncharacterized Zn finger protein (UPF0148 family)
MNLSKAFNYIYCECGKDGTLLRRSTGEYYCYDCAEELLKELEKESLEEKSEQRALDKERL